jgi:hypothetical protein
VFAGRGARGGGKLPVNRPMESNSIFSPGGNGLTGRRERARAWAVGNCAIAMPAATGAGGNGLRVAEIENVEIAATGVDPMARSIRGALDAHVRALSGAVAAVERVPEHRYSRDEYGHCDSGAAGAAPAGLNADSNRWQNITIQATHAFTAAAGSNNVLDNVVALAGNSAATGEPPTGLVLDFERGQNRNRDGRCGTRWCCRRGTRCSRNLTVTAAGGAVTAVTVGSGARAGIRSVWNAGSACVQRELHGAGNGGVNAMGRLGRYGDAGRSGLLGNDDGERERGGETGIRRRR